MKNSVLEKISKHTLRVAVIGLGYVGLPLATTFAEAGFHTTGIDVDQKKVDQANCGESYIPDIPDNLLRRLIDEECLNFASDYTIWMIRMPSLFVFPLLWERPTIPTFRMLSQQLSE